MKRIILIGLLAFGSTLPSFASGIRMSAPNYSAIDDLQAAWAEQQYEAQVQQQLDALAAQQQAQYNALAAQQRYMAELLYQREQYLQELLDDEN